MGKDIYDLLNDIKTDADEQLENNDFEELSEFETKKIMSHITGTKKSNKNRYIPIAVGFAAALALAVSIWAWRSTSTNKDSSDTTIASNEPTTEVTVAQNTTEEVITTEDVNTTEEHTTEEDTSLTIEKHDFKVLCARMNKSDVATAGDTSPVDDFKVSIWDGLGYSGDLSWTNMLFKIEGDDISKVHISIDKCSLYTQDVTDIDVDTFMNSSIDPSDWGYGEMTYSRVLVPYFPYDTAESIDLAEIVGTDYSCDYVPERKYGFFIPSEEVQPIISEIPEEAGVYDWNDSELIVDLLRNAKLTIEVTYTDGEVVKKVYSVQPGNLKYYTTDGGRHIATTEFAAEGEEGEYGIVLEEIPE